MDIGISSGRIIRHDITNEEGKKIGEIAYNPNDIKSLDKFWGVYDTLNTGSQRQKELETELDALGTDIMDEDLETTEDFEKAGKVISKSREVFTEAMGTIEEVKAGLDEVFGAGTCDLFMRGYSDTEMLTPLFNAVMPDFEKASEERKEYVDQYKKNRAERRAAKTKKAGT